MRSIVCFFLNQIRHLLSNNDKTISPRFLWDFNQMKKLKNIFQQISSLRVSILFAQDLMFQMSVDNMSVMRLTLRLGSGWLVQEESRSSHHPGWPAWPSGSLPGTRVLTIRWYVVTVMPRYYVVVVRGNQPLASCWSSAITGWSVLSGLPTLLTSFSFKLISTLLKVG